MQVAIKQLQIFRTQGRANRLLFSRCECNPLKPAKLLYRSSHWSKTFTNVELNSFNPGSFSGILNVYTYAHLTILLDHWWIHAKVAVLKSRVAQPVSERIQRCARHIHIPLRLCPAAINPIGFRELVVVVSRQLARTARNRNGQTAAGVVVPKKHIGESVAATLARHPSFNHRGQMLCFPSDREWSPVHQNQNGRCPGGVNDTDQFFLHSR